MAELYLALLQGDFGFEKLVAVKCVLPFFRDEPEFIAMLLDEARLAATLSHPNIVHVFDAGQVDGTYYLAMEYIEGADLRTLLRRMVALGERRPPLEHALLVVTQVLAGLAHAHAKCDFDGTPLSIVHRDISPHNVLVTYGGDVKIVDFGIARGALQLGERTKAGVLKGKAAYMSPEQASGRPVDGRSDLFSVGVLLFELSTGCRLFRGETETETLWRVCYGELPRPTDLCPVYPRDLEAIVAKALERDPAQRYQRARDMLADLESFAASARLSLSRAAFARWAEPFLADTRARQQELFRGIRDSDPADPASEPPESGDRSLRGHSSRRPPCSPSSTPPPLSDTAGRSVTLPSQPLGSVRRRSWLSPSWRMAAALFILVGALGALAVAREDQNGWLAQRLSAMPGGRTVVTHLQGWVGGALERAWPTRPRAMSPSPVPSAAPRRP
jgi:serine/threonine-protein kinase